MTPGTAPGASRYPGRNAPGNPRSGGFGRPAAPIPYKEADARMTPREPRESQGAFERPGAKDNGRRPWFEPRLTPGPQGLNISEEGAYVLAFPA
jgi:hypothetical protein